LEGFVEINRQVWHNLFSMKGKKPSKVYVATYTNEGLKFQMVLGPLKFEPSKRGRPTVTI